MGFCVNSESFEKIKGKIQKFLWLNDNTNIKHKTFGYSREILRKKCIAINVCISNIREYSNK